MTRIAVGSRSGRYGGELRPTGATDASTRSDPPPVPRPHRTRRSLGIRRPTAPSTPRDRFRRRRDFGLNPVRFPKTHIKTETKRVRAGRSSRTRGTYPSAGSVRVWSSITRRGPALMVDVGPPPPTTVGFPTPVLRRRIAEQRPNPGTIWTRRRRSPHGAPLAHGKGPGGRTPLTGPLGASATRRLRPRRVASGDDRPAPRERLRTPRRRPSGSPPRGGGRDPVGAGRRPRAR